MIFKIQVRKNFNFCKFDRIMHLCLFKKPLHVLSLSAWIQILYANFNFLLNLKKNQQKQQCIFLALKDQYFDIIQYYTFFCVCCLLSFCHSVLSAGLLHVICGFCNTPKLLNSYLISYANLLFIEIMIGKAAIRKE